MDLADWYAQYGDFSKLNEMGVDTSYLQFIQNQEYLSAMMGGGSGSSGGSSGGNGGNGYKDSGDQSKNDIVSYMLSLGSDAAAKQYLLGLNLSQWEYNEYMEMYEAAKQNTDNLSIDMNSVNQLGYGPIDSDSLAELEEKGEIESYVEGNKIKFKKKSSSNRINKPGALPGWASFLRG